ncbi:3-isopropylmalate/(R)-2-methylmalate dehydratase large subunit [Erwinia amylovora Ea644]|nr:3-isopropylmalate/(R)-2-methylmalate dehydratase large subunit [Erwinia amylovora Ea644]
MIPDHFVYSADPQANQNTRMMREFSRQQQIVYSYAVGTP